MKSSKLLLAFLSGFSLYFHVGCVAATNDDDTVFAEPSDEPTDPKFDANTVAFTELSNLSPLSDGTSFVKVIKSEAQFNKVFGSDVAADVDFTKEWVVVFAAGSRTTGGYSAHIDAISLNDKTLEVATRVESPNADCTVTQTTTNPSVTVKIARPLTSVSRASFSLVNKLYSCSAPASMILEFDGEPSAVAVGDIDGDGLPDLALLTVTTRQLGPLAFDGEFAVVVAWGNRDGRFAERLIQPIGQAPFLTSRDTSSHIVLVEDWDGDGRLDVVTSSGALMGTGTKLPSWRPLADAEKNGLRPVALVDLGTGKELIRARSTNESGGTLSSPPLARLERCRTTDACLFLDGEFPAYHPEDGDMVVGDFDHDRKPDLFAGFTTNVRFDLTQNVSYLWSSSKAYGNPTKHDISAVDLAVGDIDGDGFEEVIAQGTVLINDFPSRTGVWRSLESGFHQVQNILNYDNHSNPALLVDIDRDGTLDYGQTGVDRSGVAVRLGAGGFLGVHDTEVGTDVGWLHGIHAPTSFGIQLLDLAGTGTLSAVARSPEFASPGDVSPKFPPPTGVTGGVHAHGLFIGPAVLVDAGTP